MKLKVLMVGNSGTVKGGITSVISQLMEYDWNNDNIEMKFIPTYIEETNIRKFLFYIKAYKKIKKEFLYSKPNIVHIHMSYKGSFFRKYLIHKLCKKYKVPDIIHLHGSEFEKWYEASNIIIKEKIRTLLKECRALIVLGNKWNDAIKKIEPEANTIIVNNTVKIPNVVVKWDIPIKILYLGVLIKRKGVSDLLLAIKFLKENNILNSRVHFIIAGSGSEEENLKKQADNLEIKEYIDFIGWVSGEKKNILLKNSQILILPSYNEGLPIAILEAISYGLPVIATDVGDVSTAVKEGINGFIYQPGDINSLAKIINKITSDEEKYKKMSKMSRKIAEDYFSDETYFNRIRELYYKLVK